MDHFSWKQSSLFALFMFLTISSYSQKATKTSLKSTAKKATNFKTVTPQFQTITTFEEDFARVQYNGKWGFLHQNGRIIRAQYQDAQAFSEGLAAVKIGQKWTYIDTKGKVILKADYQQVMPFKNGLALVQKNKLWGIINNLGVLVTKPKYEKLDFFKNKSKHLYAKFEKQGKVGIVNHKLQETVPARYEDLKAIAPQIIAFKEKGRWGIMDISRRILQVANLSEVADYQAGRQWVKFSKTGLWGAINQQGQVSVSPTLSFIEPTTENGFTKVRKSGRWGLISPTGKLIIAPEYDKIEIEVLDKEANTNAKKTVFRVKKQGEWTLLNDLGQILSQPIFDKMEPFNNGFSKVKKENKWGFINETGVEIVPTKYDRIKDFNEGLAAVQVDGLWGFIDSRGTLSISPQYNDCQSFKDGLAAVMQMNQNEVKTQSEAVRTGLTNRLFKESKGFVALKKTTKKDRRSWGFIDKNNQIIIPLQYFLVHPFSEGYAIVADAETSKYGFIDELGNMIVAPQYALAQSFSEGLAGVFHQGRWGFIGKDGKFVILPKYAEVEPFENGRSRVRLYSPTGKGAWQWINKTGKTSQRKVAKTKLEGGLILENQEQKILEQADLRQEMASWGILNTSQQVIDIEELSAFYLNKKLNYALIKKNNKWGMLIKLPKRKDSSN